MHPVQIGKEEIITWDNKVPFLESDVISQLLCSYSLAIDKSGFIFQITYDFKLFHSITKEIVFHSIAECLYDMLRDEIPPTQKEVELVFYKAYSFFKREFDKRKINTTLLTINLVSFDPEMIYIKSSYKSIQEHISKKE